MKYKAKILKGRGDGKRIGIPTLNFEMPSAFPVKYGIYAGWVWIGEDKYPAAFHYGPVPTFGIPEPSLEAHLIGETIGSAPETAEFELVEYLREILDFNGIAELQSQIAKDVEDTKRVLRLHEN